MPKVIQKRPKAASARIVFDTLFIDRKQFWTFWMRIQNAKHIDSCPRPFQEGSREAFLLPKWNKASKNGVQKETQKRRYCQKMWFRKRVVFGMGSGGAGGGRGGSRGWFGEDLARIRKGFLDTFWHAFMFFFFQFPSSFDVEVVIGSLALMVEIERDSSASPVSSVYNTIVQGFPVQTCFYRYIYTYKYIYIYIA